MQVNAGEQNPKNPILYSQPRTGLFSVKHAQLLAQGSDLETEAVAGMKEGAKTTSQS